MKKLLQRQRTSGSVPALPHRGGPTPRLPAADRQQLVAAGRPAVGRWQTLQTLDLRRKKRVCTPPSATLSA